MSVDDRLAARGWGRRWRLALGLGLLGLLLAACDASQPGTSTGSVPSPTGSLRVAAAADLRYAMDDIVGRWRAAHPETAVEVVYGSSGNFFAQISQGAPFDVYFSADIDYPKRLAGVGLADPGTLRRYAVGQIVAWVPADSPLDVEALGLRVVSEPTVRRVAIANPEHAPYGRAAMAALESAGLAAVVEPKLVLGENVSQAAQFVESGNADVGVIALSLARAPTLQNKGRYALVPLSSYPTIEQGAVVLTGSDRRPEAQAFLDFVLGPEGRAILDAYGFLLP